MNRYGRLPDEEEQYLAYRRAIEGMQGMPVTIRTIDIGADEKIKLKGEIHRLVAPRDQKHQSNFVEFRNMSKIIYRRYAGLFFCACVDTNDNELAYLEAIHFFVEVLDAFFGNVCELDLVFNFYKVYAILDEVFLAGEIEETSKQVVLTRLAHLDKLE